MVNSCAAFNCTNNVKKRKDLSFHRFPLTDKKRLQEWLVKIRREGFVPTIYSVICSEHFEPSCFWQNPNKKLLMPSAIPTIFNFPGSLKKRVHTRPPPKERSAALDSGNGDVEMQEESGHSTVEASMKDLLHDHSYEINSEDKLSKCEYVLNRKVKSIEKYKARLDNNAAKINVRDRKIKSMSNMIEELKEKVHITKGLESVLENKFADIFIELTNLEKSGRNAGYISNVKRFALTM
ncbi:THAP domain-containing protein 1-like [Nilaparvata lugens]|uniref:THAP domain-containing protein 1-like n=1 Tax=Nilaparvata lugens TaxID=108931 RepID=UPI00193DC190|nr:THAP domain-containing protein 1-like [Nilaparvata lugens]